MEQEKYLSTGQLMALLEISRSTVYRLMAKGMPNIMVGSVHRFPKLDVVEWLKNHNQYALMVQTKNHRESLIPR